MSDNPMRLKVSFSDENAARKVKKIFQSAQDWIVSKTDKEYFLGDYISNKGLAEGITFDSFWIPNGEIETEGNSLIFELVGSPGDDLPGDIVLWLGKFDATSAKGTIEISGTGDVIDIDHSF